MPKHKVKPIMGPSAKKVIVRWKIDGWLGGENEILRRRTGDEDIMKESKAKKMIINGQVDLVGPLVKIAPKRTLGRGKATVKKKTRRKYTRRKTTEGTEDVNS